MDLVLIGHGHHAESNNVGDSNIIPVCTNAYVGEVIFGIGLRWGFSAAM